MGLVYSKLTTITALPVSLTLATSSAVLQYTNPVTTNTFVAEIELHNTNNAVATVVLYAVPDNSGALGSPSITSEIIRVALQAYDTLWIEPNFPYVLQNVNESVWGVSTLSGVNIQLRGRKDQ